MATADLTGSRRIYPPDGRRPEDAAPRVRRPAHRPRHPGLLEPVKVEAYGTEMPLTQVGTIGVPEPRMITVQVWDRSLVNAVETAIRDPASASTPPPTGRSCACRSRN